MKYFIKEYTESEQKVTDFKELLENYINKKASEGWKVDSTTVLNGKLTILFRNEKTD